MGLNIASAFRLRNKLKERIKELTRTCGRATVTKPIGKAENTTVFDGKTLADTIANISLLMSTLKDFNLAIEKANTANKEDLITMETLKAEIAFYDVIVSKIRGAREFEYEDNPEGGRDKIELELVVNQQEMVNYWKNLIKKREVIEEKLAISNLAIQVDFDKEIIKKLL